MLEMDQVYVFTIIMRAMRQLKLLTVSYSCFRLAVSRY